VPFITVAQPVTPNEAAASAAADTIFFTLDSPQANKGTIAPGEGEAETELFRKLN
jgi:hypothetical protein